MGLSDRRPRKGFHREAAARQAVTLLVLLAVLPACQWWDPQRELLTYRPGEAFEGVTLFGLIGQPEFFFLEHGYMNAVPMSSGGPAPGVLEPIWEFEHSPGGLILDAKRLPGGTVLTVRGIFFGNRMQEIDPATKEVLWTHRTDGVHHDADLLPDGSYIYLSSAMVRDPDFGLMNVDHVRVTNRAHQTIWDWSLYENDPAGNPLLPGQCPHILPLPWKEWSHCNAVTFLAGEDWAPGSPLHGHIYLNCRQFNRIYKIAYPAGSIEWVLGDGGDFGRGLFSQAHDPEISVETDARGNRRTRILMMDNGSCRPAGPCPPDEAPCPPGIEPYSRALEILVEREDDPAARTASIVWKWPSPHDPDFEVNRFYSAVMGDADRLPNGNVLITVSAEDGAFFDLEHPSRGRLIEVKPDGTLTGGETVWEMRTNRGYGIYRAQRIPLEDWPF